MTPSETAQLLGKFAGAYNLEINDATALVWGQLLADTAVHHANEVAELYVRTEKYMPRPAEFLASLQELERRDARQELTERNTTAAYRCDGTRWRCAEHHGKCPIDCTADKGMEPCPTCNEVQYERLTMSEASNRKWRSGGTFADVATVLPDACRPLRSTEVVAMPPGLADSDWLNTRRDVM